MTHVVHFIGFRGDEYWAAVKVWGKPDYIHRVWDRRARREIDFEHDTLVFANEADPAVFSARSGNDLDEPDDPSEAERREDGRSRLH